MKFISLVDTKDYSIITIDASRVILRLEIDGTAKETRLKPYMACILYELFNKHPTPISYGKIISLLKHHDLIISDSTRMHRKLSEIRQFIAKFHPSLNELILNTRGVGYSLPLRLKSLHEMTQPQNNAKFKNHKINKALENLHHLINDAIDMTRQSKVIHHTQGYVINRRPLGQELIEKVFAFNACEKILLKEIRTHEADFIGLRIAYLLAKMKTYIGLARISEYPISETQWLDWFRHEVWLLFEELKKWIKMAEST